MPVYNLPRVTRLANYSTDTATMAANECGFHQHVIMNKVKSMAYKDEVLNYNLNLPYDGSGVDYVVLEGNSMVDPTHPEWLDRNGNSRFVQTNWPQEAGEPWASNVIQKSDYYDNRSYAGNHANGTTSSCAGLYYGLAKGAAIRVLTRDGFTASNWDFASMMYMLKDWHLNKPDKSRPTLVSWGTVPAFILSYATAKKAKKDSELLVKSLGATKEQMSQACGMKLEDVDTSYVLAPSKPVKDAIQAGIDAGIHVFIPSGNKSAYMAIDPTDSRWNSAVYWDSEFNMNTSRGFVCPDVVVTGAVNGDDRNKGGKEYIEGYSAKGRRIDFFVPVGRIPAVVSHRSGDPEDLTTIASDIKVYPFAGGGNYYRGTYSGTSAASPIMAGLACCYLEKYPSISPGGLKALLKAHAAKGRLWEPSDLDNFNNDENHMHPEPLYPHYGLK
jgi:hypothetical protein